MKNWSSQIDQNTSQFIELFSGLSNKDLNWKPDPNTWSIAQNIDHLMVINQSYFPLLDDLKAGRYKAPFIARLDFVVNFLGKTILNAVEPSRKKKTKTFPIWEPDTGVISFDVLERFEAHQDRLKRAIASAEDLVNAGAVISSPANHNIVYKLEIAFDIMVTHESRHLEQAKEILEMLKKNQKSLSPSV